MNNPTISELKEMVNILFKQIVKKDSEISSLSFELTLQKLLYKNLESTANTLLSLSK